MLELGFDELWRVKERGESICINLLISLSSGFPASQEASYRAELERIENAVEEDGKSAKNE